MTDKDCKDTLMQLFVYGPTWDGNILSKEERTHLKTIGLVDKHEGWNYLTANGVKAALEAGLSSPKHSAWYKKASRQ